MTREGARPWPERDARPVFQNSRGPRDEPGNYTRGAHEPLRTRDRSVSVPFWMQSDDPISCDTKRALENRTERQTPGLLNIGFDFIGICGLCAR